jgi:hypothetical protein
VQTEVVGDANSNRRAPRALEVEGRPFKKIEKVFDIIFLQILSINFVKKKSKNNSHVRYLLNFQSKKGPDRG